MKNLVLTEGELIRLNNQIYRIPLAVMALVALFEGTYMLFGWRVDNEFPPILAWWYHDYEGGAFFKALLKIIFEVRPLFDILGAGLLSYFIVRGSWSLAKSQLIIVKETVFIIPAAYLIMFLLAHLINTLSNEAGVYLWMLGLILSMFLCLLIDKKAKFIYLYNAAIVCFVIMIFKGFVPAAVFALPFIIGTVTVLFIRLISLGTIKKFFTGEDY